MEGGHASHGETLKAEDLGAGLCGFEEEAGRGFGEEDGCQAVDIWAYTERLWVVWWSDVVLIVRFGGVLGGRRWCRFGKGGIGAFLEDEGI